MSWLWKLGVNSSFAVTLYPTFDYMNSAKKVESKIRTSDGTRWQYKWGEFNKINFSVNYVSSANKCTINSWWGAETNLLWMQVDSGGAITEIYSCYIANVEKPLTQNNKPYIDLFKGKLKLES